MKTVQNLSGLNVLNRCLKWINMYFDKKILLLFYRPIDPLKESSDWAYKLKSCSNNIELRCETFACQMISIDNQITMRTNSARVKIVNGLFISFFLARNIIVQRAYTFFHYTLSGNIKYIITFPIDEWLLSIFRLKPVQWQKCDRKRWRRQ